MDVDRQSYHRRSYGAQKSEGCLRCINIGLTYRLSLIYALEAPTYIRSDLDGVVKHPGHVDNTETGWQEESESEGNKGLCFAVLVILSLVRTYGREVTVVQPSIRMREVRQWCALPGNAHVLSASCEIGRTENDVAHRYDLP